MSEIDWNEPYVFTERVPDWARYLLKKHGIPDVIIPSELSLDQMRDIVLVFDLVKAVEEGYLEVHWDGKSEPTFTPTPKCIEEVERKYGKIR